MILLTFDDAINFENWDLYTKKIFTAERKNPNGCPIKVKSLYGQVKKKPICDAPNCVTMQKLRQRVKFRNVSNTNNFQSIVRVTHDGFFCSLHFFHHRDSYKFSPLFSISWNTHSTLVHFLYFPSIYQLSASAENVEWWTWNCCALNNVSKIIVTFTGKP